MDYIQGFRVWALASIEAGGNKDSLDGYVYDIEHYCQWAESMGRAHGANAVTDYLKHLQRDKHYQANTLRRRRASLRNFYRYLASLNPPGIDAGALDLIDPIAKAFEDLTVLSDNEVARLVEAIEKRGSECSTRDRAIVRLLYSSGIRVSELVGLNLQDLDLLACKRTEFKVMGKGRKERMVMTDQSVLQEIAVYVATSRAEHARRRVADKDSEQPRPHRLFKRRAVKDEPLFLRHTDGRRITRQLVSDSIYRAAQLAGLKMIRAHVLRHSYATNQLNEGVPTQDVQVALGHSLARTTQVYLHMAHKKLMDDYRRFFRPPTSMPGGD